MIARLRGELVAVEGGAVVVECGGVGYEAFVAEAACLPAVGEEATLWVRSVTREDGTTLYGFVEPSERRLFDHLLSVTGCGPKAALALLGSLGGPGLAVAVANGDVRELCRAPGVGRKIAERLVLELRDKMAAEATLSRVSARPSPTAKPDDELVEALVQLGYRRPEAETAAAEAREETSDEAAALRAALRRLRK